jgi:hypothetical protein
MVVGALRGGGHFGRVPGVSEGQQVGVLGEAARSVVIERDVLPVDDGVAAPGTVVVAVLDHVAKGSGRPSKPSEAGRRSFIGAVEPGGAGLAGRGRRRREPDGPVLKPVARAARRLPLKPTVVHPDEGRGEKEADRESDADDEDHDGRTGMAAGQVPGRAERSGGQDPSRDRRGDVRRVQPLVAGADCPQILAARRRKAAASACVLFQPAAPEGVLPPLFDRALRCAVLQRTGRQLPEFPAGERSGQADLMGQHGVEVSQPGATFAWVGPRTGLRRRLLAGEGGRVPWSRFLVGRSAAKLGAGHAAIVAGAEDVLIVFARRTRSDLSAADAARSCVRNRVH